MLPSRIHEVLAGALEGRRLLEHPFYRRWEEGSLCDGELAAYAEQYRHVEAALPGVLRAIAGSLPEGPARRLTEANLAEEVGAPEAHLDLFESFARAAGASSAVPTPATEQLMGVQRQAAASGAVAGLAALAAYEIQAPAIASTKSQALRTHYAYDQDATRFWDVHATLEADHAEWLVEALASLDALDDDVARWAAEAAGAWWSFLDEREAAAALVS